MVSLIGTYECKMDAKGRVLLPAAYKKQLADFVEEGFVVKRSVFQSCLEVYPMQEWRLVMAKLNKLNRFVKKNNDFIRRFTAGVKTVEMDASGRFLIPKDLCQFANLKKEIVLSSGVTIFEVWDKGSYEEVLEDAVVDFADLAEEVMGNIEIDELP